MQSILGLMPMGGDVYAASFRLVGRVRGQPDERASDDRDQSRFAAKPLKNLGVASGEVPDNYLLERLPLPLVA